MRKAPLRFLRVFIVLSVIGNVFFLFLIVSPTIARRWSEKQFHSARVDTDSAFEQLLRSGSMELLAAEYSTDASLVYCHSVQEVVAHYLHKSDFNVYEYGEYGYLLYFAFSYAKAKGDKELLEIVKQKFDEGFMAKESISIRRNDQTSYGCVGCCLYKEYHDERYKHFCNALLDRLWDQYQKDGNVYYHNSIVQSVDGVGLIAPFLSLYAKTFNESKNVEKAWTVYDKIVGEYLLYGCDPANGLPCKHYQTATHIKSSTANWGRGTSWLLLAIGDNCSRFDGEGQRMVNRMDSTLMSMVPLYHQWIGMKETSAADMSATVPILYYLTASGKLKLKRNEFSALVMKFTDKKGVIRYNSPSFMMQREQPNAFQAHFLTQAIALYMMSYLP